MDKHFILEIVTPVKTLDFEKVDYLRAPSLEGLFGLLPYTELLEAYIKCDISNCLQHSRILAIPNRLLST